MNGRGRIGTLLVASAVLALALSACLPFPPVIHGPESTRSVFVPGVVESGADVSPLLPPPTEPAAAPAQLGAIRLQGPVWEWTASRFIEGGALAPGDPSRYTVEFLEDGNALVQADCNFGAGLYKEAGDRLTIGAIGATKTACPPDSLDSAFLAQLGKAERFAIDGATLILSLQDRAGEMRLAAQPGTLPTVAPPTPTPLPATAAPTHTGAPPPTAPPTVTALPTATEPAATATTAPPALPTAAFTATPVPATAAPPVTPTTVEIRSQTWVLRSLTVGGEKKPVMGDTPATLEISPDGLRVSGSTGCNEYRAGVTLAGQNIAFSGAALLTRTACEWPVMLQEVELIDALQRAMSYRFEDGFLVLAGADGENLAEFTGK